MTWFLPRALWVLLVLTLGGVLGFLLGVLLGTPLGVLTPLP